MMESQILPKAGVAELAEAAEVADLELQAVIGFNGEAMSMSGLGGVGTLGCVALTGAVRQRVVPGRQVGCWHGPWPGPYMGAGGGGGGRGRQLLLRKSLRESILRSKSQ